MSFRVRECMKFIEGGCELRNTVFETHYESRGCSHPVDTRHLLAEFEKFVFK